MKPRLFICAIVLLSLLAGCGSPRQQGTAEPPAFGYTDQWGVTGAGMAQSILPGEPNENSTSTFREGDEGVDQILSQREIAAAMETYGIASDSVGAQALEAIETVYQQKLPRGERADLLIFFFEGAGLDQSVQVHNNAMCVVIRSGKIVYLDQISTTIPDYPFTPSKNDYYDMPTLKSGIYWFDTVNHNDSYAALQVLDDRVVRFHNQQTFYESVSNEESIQIHRRRRDELAPEDEDWGNSVGCLLVGDADTDPDAPYTRFLKAVGVIPEHADGNSLYRSRATGQVIVDRSFAREYLLAVGYSQEAIDLIG